MTTTEALPAKMVERKTVILKSRLDATMVKLLGEKIKTRFFSRRSFLKPKPQEIQLVCVDKFYEPYIIVGGKYAIDYCKKCLLPVRVSEKMQEIFILGKEFKPSPSGNVVKLEGEGHFHYEDEGYFVLDKWGHEVSPEQLSYAPPEEELEKVVKVATKLREVKISPKQEIEFLRSRIAKRPSDVEEILNELFEVTERTVIYRPTYELMFRDLKTGIEAIVEIDGTTGKIIRYRKG